MSVHVSGTGCFGDWCDFGGKVIEVIFKVDHLKIKPSGIQLNFTCTNIGLNFSSKEVLQ